MDIKIVVEIEYTNNEIRNALFEVINKVNQCWVFSLCAIIAVGCVLLIELRNGFSNYYNGMLFVFVVVYLIIIAIFYIYPINRYIEVYRERRKSTFIFSKESIEMIRSEVQSTCKWSIFKKAFELKKYIILADVNKGLYILPKRAFKNELDLEEFKNLLRENIKNVKKYFK